MKESFKFDFSKLWVGCLIFLFGMTIIGGISYKGTESATAGTANVSVECDSTSVAVGQELTCYIKGTADYEVGSFSGKIGSDSKLSLTDITVDSFWGMNNINKTTGKITVSGKNPDSGGYTGGNINTKFNFATFKVKGVTVGSSTITISDIIVTANYNDVEKEDATVTISVVESSGGSEGTGGTGGSSGETGDSGDTESGGSTATGTANVFVECANSSVTVGQELTCYIKGTADYEVGSFSGKINSDGKLSLTDITAESFWGMKNVNKTTGKITVSGKNPDSDGYTGGNINTKFNFATFKVKGVTVGSSTITISDIIVTANYNDVEKEDATITISVVQSGGTGGGEQPSETKYIATFNANGGTLSGDTQKICTVESGTTCDVFDLPTATKSGYTFAGWNTANGCTSGEKSKLTLSSSTTYYACWVQNSSSSSSGGNEQPSETKYTVTFNANGGTLNGDTQKTCTVASGTTCEVTSLPTATKNGYTFAGWNTANGCTSGEKSKLTLSSSATYYACWVQNSSSSSGGSGGNEQPKETKYTVTFNANGGTLRGDTQKICTVESGTTCEVFDLPTATKSGYTFSGWNTSSSCTSGIEDELTLSSSITYYACFVKNPTSSSGGSGGNEQPKETKYTATFNANGGTLSGSSSKSCVLSSGATSCKITDLPLAAKAGYTFSGWNTSSSCTSGSKTSLTLTSDGIKYYACFVKNQTTGGNNNQGNNGNNNSNVQQNPQTSSVVTIIVMILALFSGAYSLYYFKKMKEN